MEYICTHPDFSFAVNLKSKPIVSGKNYIVVADTSDELNNRCMKIFDFNKHEKAFKQYSLRITHICENYWQNGFSQRYLPKSLPEFLTDIPPISVSKTDQRRFCAVRFSCSAAAKTMYNAYNSEANVSAGLLTNMMMGLFSAVFELKHSIPEILGLDMDSVLALGTKPMFIDFLLDENQDCPNKFLFSSFESKDKRQGMFNFFVAIHCFLETGKVCTNIEEVRNERDGVYGKMLDETMEKVRSRQSEKSDKVLSLGDYRAVLYAYLSKDRNHLPKIINHIPPKSGTPVSYMLHRDILEKAYEIKDYNYNELELKQDYYSLSKNPNRKVRVNITGKHGDPEFSFNRETQTVRISGGDEICFGFKDKENNKPPIFNFQADAVATFVNSFNGRGILADQVGMGKTIEAGLIISEYAARPDSESRWKTLLIVSKTGENDDGEGGRLIKQWRDEMAEKFGLFVKHLERQDKNATASEYLLDRVAPLFDGEKRRRTVPIKGVHNGGALCYPVCIISYQDFIKQSKYFKENPNLKPPQIDMLVVDEAHQLITSKLLDAVDRCVKNPSKILTDDEMFSKSVSLNLVRMLISKYCILMTATPHKGDLTMLYPYMKLLKQSERGYENISEFFQNICKGRKTVKEFKEHYGSGALEEIRAMMRVVAVRNTRNNTKLQIEWKRKFSHVFYFKNTNGDMDSQAYEDLFDLSSDLRYKKSLRDKSDIEVVNYQGDDAESLQQAKLNTLQRIARRHAKEKIIVFFDADTVSEENARRRKIKKQLEKLLTNRRVFDDAAEFENEEKLFGSSNGVLLADAKSSEGRNLQFCHVLVNFDIMKCPMKMEQRIGRIDRIGQVNDMMIYSFGALSGLDGQLLALYDNVLEIFSQWNGDIMYVAGSVFGTNEGEGAEKGSMFEKRVTEAWKRLVKGPKDYAEWSKFWHEKADMLAKELEYTRDDILDDLKTDEIDSYANQKTGIDKDGSLVAVEQESEYKHVNSFLETTAAALFGYTIQLVT